MRTSIDLPKARAKKINQIEIQRLISTFVLDSDPHVRKSSLDALVQMHVRGCPLDLSLYALAVQSLRDDFDEVRMGGLNLIGALSSLYPERQMKLAHEQVKDTVRLIDDAFVRICDLVNDASPIIRTKACILMASYQHVNTHVLAQTFSKQIMSHLKRRTMQHRPSKHKKTTEIPIAEGDIDVQSDEFHLLDSGACGAFVHGLEDEYKEVRSAAIDSICELCMYNDHLAGKAIICLVDMFNDEIDKVRINAIQSLRKIGTRTILEFDAEQLEIALGALDDSDRVAREATHDLIKVMRLTEKNTLTTLLDGLMTNMKRYPQDQLSIYRCLRDVGRRHADYVETLIPTLLSLDKRYLPREMNMEDHVYIANVILIVNACTTDPSMLTVLPKYMFRHFVYLQSRYSDCIPDLRELLKTANMELQADVDCLPVSSSAFGKNLLDAKDVDDYVMSTLDTLTKLRTLMLRSEYTVALKTIEVATKNFRYITTLKPMLAGKAELAILYLECYEHAIKIIQSHSSPTYAATAQVTASALLRLTYTMQYNFLGVSTQTLHALMYFRILANMTWMKLGEAGLHDQTIADLRTNLAKASTVPTMVKMTALYSFITEINLDNPVKRTRATITWPLPNRSKPLKFSSQFPIKLSVEADLYHVLDPNDIALEIVLPDQSCHVFWPTSNDFMPTTPYCYKLSVDVELLIANWTETGVVIIRIVRSFEPDLPGLDDFIMKHPNSKTTAGLTYDTRKTTSTTAISSNLKYCLCPLP
ncbi:armadillo-type protein [Radiomyces spectabilis]|uniref:armadillo-type protein n=1 Tax=Radiomyces spectabilis TaxID=64574 RepID=UPI002221266C|nr:armadillo-type protein [Radiomyces spectabilis]KAI8374468.1 armadillo-type protein [Radiomyces spectabilis]